MLGVTLYNSWYLQPLFCWRHLVQRIDTRRASYFPIRPPQDNLARSYEQLAQYLELKSRLFDPDIEDESQALCTIWRSLTASWLRCLTRRKRLY